MMFLLKFLPFALTFSGLFVDLDAVICPKGQKVKKTRTPAYTCEACPHGYYQPTENPSMNCIACTRCRTELGSEIKQMCTKETDTTCVCRAGFVLHESDASICKCDAGSGLRNGECVRCEDGSFTSSINSPCKKWKECPSGVNTTGTRTKDVICNQMSNPGTTGDDVTSPPRGRRPQEETRAHTVFPTTTSTSTTTTSDNSATSSSTPAVTTKRKVDPPAASNTGAHIGVVLLMLGIVGLLLLTTLTCKLHVAPNVQRKPAEPIKDSVCRRPVEESGDSSELTVKLNVLEP